MEERNQRARDWRTEEEIKKKGREVQNRIDRSVYRLLRGGESLGFSNRLAALLSTVINVTTIVLFTGKGRRKRRGKKRKRRRKKRRRRRKKS